jgi:hypothetical protein
MTFTDTAAAYGLFQVVFADVTNHLAIATFRLRECNEPGLRFEAVYAQEFAKTFKQLKVALCQFDGCSGISDSLSAVRATFTIISELAKWRNDRVHARVRMSEQGYELYDWRTGKRLDISLEQVEANINRAVKVMVNLEAHVHRFVHQLKWDEEFERLFSMIPEPLEAPDDTEAD